MTTLITPIQYGFGSPHHSNQSSKINERNTNWKGRSITIMFADDMLLYIENPKDSTKNLMALTSEFDKVTLYKINSQKSLAFQYTNNKRGKNSISHCNNNNKKHLGINLIFLLLQWDEAGASLVVQMIKNLPAVQETQIRSLGQEDTLEKGMAIHSSILAWRISWTEEPGRLQSMGFQRIGHD